MIGCPLTGEIVEHAGNRRRHLFFQNHAAIQWEAKYRRKCVCFSLGGKQRSKGAISGWLEFTGRYSEDPGWISVRPKTHAVRCTGVAHSHFARRR